MTPEQNVSANERRSSPVLVLLAWLLVSAPLGWGVYNTVLNSMKLFQAPQKAAPTQPSAPSHTPANPAKP